MISTNSSHPATKHPDFVPGLLVVKIKKDAVANAPDLRRASVAALKSFGLPSALEESFAHLHRKRLIKEVVPVFAPAAPAGIRRRVALTAAVALATSVREPKDETLQGINLLRLSPAADLARLEKNLKGSPGIEYCHRVPARWPAGARAKATSADPLVNRQWGLRAIRWFDTNPLPDARQVKVAVLDTGIDDGHPELQSAVAGYIHDGSSAADIIGHGTHVSGIIAADPDNHIGIAGICRCRLHVWKIFGHEPAPDGKYYVDELMYLRALNAARASGMQVMNLSIGGTQHSRTEETLFRNLVGAGVTVVAAMGNEFEEGNPIEYPGAYPGVVAVGATNEVNNRAPFSNTGSRIALCAPGTNILSTLPRQPSAARGADETNYAAWSGTSMATPHVTAGATLVLAAHPDFSPNRVADRLKSSAARLPGMGNRKRTREYGSGLLDLKKAVA